MQTHKRRSLILALLAGIATMEMVAQSRGSDPMTPFLEDRPISIVRLLATPERYDSLKITVMGYLHWRFEDCGLYLSKTDADYQNSGNAFWIYLSKKIRKRQLNHQEVTDTLQSLDSFDSKYVYIKGTFYKDKTGHLNSFSGTLASVNFISEIPQQFDGKKRLSRSHNNGTQLGGRPVDTK